jgi:glutaredoxin
MNKVEVFSKPGCKYCIIAKYKLESLGIPYTEINIHDEKYFPIETGENSCEEHDRFQERLAFARNSTVPQIYIDSFRVGGCQELIRSIESGALWEKVREYNIATMEGVARPPLSHKTVDQKENEEATTRMPFSIDGFLSSLASDEVINSCEVRKKLLSFFPKYVSPKSLYELISHLYHMSNSILDIFSKKASLQTISHRMKKSQLLDYHSLRSSQLLFHWLLLSTELALIPFTDLEHLNDKEKICFFVNVYNIIVVQGKCVFYPSSEPEITDSEKGGNSEKEKSKEDQQIEETLKKDLKDVFQFFTKVKYNISGLVFSLDDIEHGILRANQPHPSNQQPLSTMNRTYFPENDKRSLLAVKGEEFDPRIHFVINCGAKSCPAISLLSSDNLEESLTIATHSYLEGEISLDIVDQKSITLPKLLLWYGKDFGFSYFAMFRRIYNLLSGVSRYSDSNLLKILQYLVVDYGESEEFRMDVISHDEEGGIKGNESFYGKYQVLYRDYDWSLNRFE